MDVYGGLSGLYRAKIVDEARQSDTLERESKDVTVTGDMLKWYGGVSVVEPICLHRT